MAEIFADLHACINSLGLNANKDNFRVDDIKASLRDILKIIRKESSSCEIRREIGNFNLVEKSLVSLSKSNPDDSNLYDLLTRLLMNVTQPAFICFKQKLPTEIESMKYYIQVDDNLQKYKKSFVDLEFWKVLVLNVNKLFIKSWSDRSEEDNMLIERTLIIMRNVLHITTSAIDGKTPNGMPNIHDKLVIAILESGWDDVLLYLANTEDESRFAFHTLEIISLIFKDQSSEFMGPSPDHKEQERKIKLQKTIVDNDMNKINYRSLKFGGTFLLPEVKCMSGRSMIYHHDVYNERIDISRDRLQRRKPKNRLPNKDELSIHVPNDDILSIYRRFCLSFLGFGYNTLMKTALAYLTRNQSQQDDETYYLWSLGFFMSVCRYYCSNKSDDSRKVTPEFVSGTLSPEIFHWVHKQIIDYIELIRSSKEGARSIFRKVQLATSVFNELLKFLMMLDQYVDNQNSENRDKYRRLSAYIKGRVFWDSEVLEMYPMLLQHFNQVSQSRAQLRQLIEGASLLIKILQKHKSFDMFVMRKSRAKKRKTSKKPLPRPVESVIMPSDDAEELLPIWSEMSVALESALKGELELPDSSSLPLLFDPLLPEGEGNQEPIEPGSEPVDCQLKRALGRVQISLRQKKPLEAVALFRLAQQLWPEEERICVGDCENPVEEELVIFKGLLMAQKFYRDEDLPGMDIEAVEESNGAEDEFDEPDFDEEPERITEEVEFDINNYLLKFCHPNVVENYGILFHDFLTNPNSTNKSLLKIMHSISERLHKPHVLYQLKLFNGFNKFLINPVSILSEFKEMRKFVLYIIKKFVADTSKNRKLLIEILLSKNLREADEMIYGYEDTEEVKNEWTPELEEELSRLFEEAKNEEILPGLDIGNVIENRFSDPSKNRRQIIGRMVAMGLIKSSKELKKKKWIAPWTEEEQSQLIILVEESRSQPNQIREIMNGLKAISFDHDNLRPRREVVKKILELGLAKSKEELGIKTRMKKQKFNDDSGSSSDESDKENKNNHYENIGNDSDEEEEERFMKDIFGKVQSSEKEKDSISAMKPPPMKTKRMVDWTTLKMTYARLNDNEREWFVEMLVDNIDSRSNGITGHLTIVPLQQFESDILKNPLMEKLLYLCYFQYPNRSEGFQFWRIPEDMSGKELEYFRNCVTSLTNEELDALTMMDFNDQESQHLPKSSPISHNLSTSKPVEKRKSKLEEVFDSDEDSSDIETFRKNLLISRKKKKHRARKIITSDEEEESVDIDNLIAETNFSSRVKLDSEDEESNGNEIKINRSKRLIFDSDEDDQPFKRIKLIEGRRQIMKFSESSP